VTVLPAVAHQLRASAKAGTVHYPTIDDRLAAEKLDLTPEFLKELHGKAMAGLGRGNDAHFKPHHEGEWRDGEAAVVDLLTQRVMHEAPPRVRFRTGWPGCSSGWRGG
jgi:hypothetical protein